MSFEDKNQDNEKNEKNEKKEDKGQSTVTIKVNGDPYEIHRGSHTGLEIRKLANCPSTFVLELLPALESIPPEKRITIKGQEEFSCHEPMGQAS